MYLELIGERNNVLCAEYIAHFLDKSFEKLYAKEKMKRTVSGTRAKNSFMLGIADGFIGKIKNETLCDEIAIIKTEKNLQAHVSKVYPNIRGRKVKENNPDLKQGH